MDLDTLGRITEASRLMREGAVWSAGLGAVFNTATALFQGLPPSPANVATTSAIGLLGGALPGTMTAGVAGGLYIAGIDHSDAVFWSLPIGLGLYTVMRHALFDQQQK